MCTMLCIPLFSDEYVGEKTYLSVMYKTVAVRMENDS